MNITPSDLARQLDLYSMHFFLYQPKNAKSVGFNIHVLVDSIIKGQIVNIYDFEDLQLASSSLEKFIRELKVEFDCIYIDIDDIEYPSFVVKIEAIKTDKAIQGYHRSVVALLKFLLFRALNSDSPKDAEDKLVLYSAKFVDSLHPHRPKKLFEDKSKESLQEPSIEEIVKRQVDIFFEDDF